MDHRTELPCVSVVTPCRNEAAFIDQFLTSLASEQDYSGRMEFIIIDGQSTDGTAERIECWCGDDPRFHLVRNPERTTPYALNYGISASSGEIIVRMDVHTEYAADYIRMCVKTLVETNADNVGGPARTRAKGYFQSANRLAYHSPFAVGGAKFHFEHYEGPVDTVVYGCWRREIFDRVGLFDTELARNQDDEFNLRTVRAGGRLWQNPAIRSWYYPRATPSSLFRQYMQYGYWKVRVIQKHRYPASWRHLVPGAFVLASYVLALASLVSPAARVGLSMLAVIYLLGCFVTGTYLCVAQKGLRLLPVMPLAFACYHFGYGVGFIRGLWDFVLRGRAARTGFGALTR